MNNLSPHDFSRSLSDDIFAYMDCLEEGESPDEIDRRLLAPVIEESQAVFRAEVERVQAIVEERLRLMEQDLKNLLAFLESGDFTGEERGRVEELRAKLSDLKAVERSLFERIEIANQHLETAHRANTHLIGQLQQFTATLKSAQGESRWVPVINQAGEGISRAVRDDDSNGAQFQVYPGMVRMTFPV